jgi:hypothetical protein
MGRFGDLDYGVAWHAVYANVQEHVWQRGPGLVKSRGDEGGGRVVAARAFAFVTGESELISCVYPAGDC